MEDKEIIKALECCIKIGVDSCSECPMSSKTSCKVIVRRRALDLINHQKAEIERLQKAIKVQVITNRIDRLAKEMTDSVNYGSSKTEGKRKNDFKEVEYGKITFKRLFM